MRPIISSLVLFTDSPWELDGFKMRFDSTEWHTSEEIGPVPVRGMSYLLMCETRGTPEPLPKIRWLRNGRPIKNRRHFYVIVSSANGLEDAKTCRNLG